MIRYQHQNKKGTKQSFDPPEPESDSDYNSPPHFPIFRYI